MRHRNERENHNVSRATNLAWVARGRTIVGGADGAPRVMGIVNVTPDSFSDGGLAASARVAVERAFTLAAEGADLIDIGGESSRPGADVVSLEEELRRVIPVVRALADRQFPAPISIDTTKAEVARQALSAGASVINDISALRFEPAMADAIAASEAGVVLMHMQGTPQTMQLDPRYDDVVKEIVDHLAERVEWTVSRGIPRERIAIDPGIGFGKTRAHNLAILRNIDRFATLGCVILIGTSRKGFLGKLTDRPPTERALASVVSSLAACEAGARVVRVHDVLMMAEAVKVWSAVRGWGELS